MIGAIAMVHWGQWNFVANEAYPMGGSEFQVTLLLVSLYFLFKAKLPLHTHAPYLNLFR